MLSTTFQRITRTLSTIQFQQVLLEAFARLDFVSKGPVSCCVVYPYRGFSYNRKTFSRDQFSKTLRRLGLTPSAVLIAS
ncbi:hypothetical protein C8R48DRAFT_712743 [Suillus tomentosus]|nr:hypothetical protein C8R48DRAFT_712743 [Suillus tomentosus]